jgi:predicted HAD superfamily Cof-like phosphohydrolase
MGFLKMSREEKVAQFNRAADNKTLAEGGDYRPHTACFGEEVTELFHAINNYLIAPNDTTRQELVKEWADAQVTLSQLAWFFDIPADPAFNRVHQNNMTKLVDGKIVRREDGKILKPEGYVKPDMSGL